MNEMIFSILISFAVLSLVEKFIWERVLQYFTILERTQGSRLNDLCISLFCINDLKWSFYYGCEVNGQVNQLLASRLNKFIHGLNLFFQSGHGLLLPLVGSQILHLNLRQICPGIEVSVFGITQIQVQDGWSAHSTPA